METSQKLRLLKTGHGDLCLAEWSGADADSVATARDVFRREAEGRIAFRLDGPGETTPIREFQADAPEILLVPPVTGG